MFQQGCLHTTSLFLRLLYRKSIPSLKFRILSDWYTGRIGAWLHWLPFEATCTDSDFAFFKHPVPYVVPLLYFTDLVVLAYATELLTLKVMQVAELASNRSELP
jgi:hypothetical protein